MENKIVCEKCGMGRVMEGVSVEPRETGTLGDYYLTMRLSRPGFLGMQSAVRGEVRATVCADCGYTELYTDNLDELWEAYQSHSKRS